MSRISISRKLTAVSRQNIFQHVLLLCGQPAGPCSSSPSSQLSLSLSSPPVLSTPSDGESGHPLGCSELEQQPTSQYN